jgi:predicted transposase/invertase (TIGR01784 family)
MYILTQNEKLNQLPKSLMEPIFMDLLEKAEIENLTPEDRDLYEYELKVYRDNYSVMKYAETVGRDIGYKEGQEIGLQEGRQKGLQEGRQEGRQEGVEVAKTEIILNGFTEGLSVSMLARITNLSEDQVIRIIESNK